MMPWLAGLLALVALWFSLRYAWWRQAVPYRYPRILMYHMVRDPVSGARFNGLRVSPAMFERQLRWLKQHGWHSCTLTKWLENRSAMPEKTVIITFDDGYADNYHNALPLLEKYDFKATLYLVVDRHDRDWSSQKKAHHDSGELGREKKLDDSEVEAMLASGRIELASHSLTHPNFARLDTNQKRQELEMSKRQLEERFGVKINSFAYPFGIFNKEDAKLVEQAGYTSAVTTEAGIDTGASLNLYRLKRVKISGKDNMLAFILRMLGGIRGWRK